jgi:hypothetical protein
MKLISFRFVPCAPVFTTGTGITMRADRLWSTDSRAF